MNTPFGVQTPTLFIDTENNAGTLSGATGASELEELKVDGSTVSFTTKVTTPMGKFPVSFEATAEGDNMSGTFKTMMGKTEFSGVRA
ncbi:MAG TPA: hypothetical protein VFY81_14800 [Gammaproteobacteria bacterium]|nr:hypothetical protein [Gammaproteobacteria bacterium]